MGQTSSIIKKEDLEIKIYDGFIELQNIMKSIKTFNTNSQENICHYKSIRKKCLECINDAKGTFDSKQNIENINEKFLGPFIANIYSLQLPSNKQRDDCIKIVRKIEKYIRKYIKLTKRKKYYNNSYELTDL